MIDRELPVNVAAERAIVGAVMIDNSAFDRVAAIIKPQDFRTKDAQALWSAFVAMEGRGIEPLTIREQLETIPGALETAGGLSGIASFIAETPDIVNVERYAHMVAEAAVRRRVIHECNRLQVAAFDSGTPVTDLATTGANLFADLAAVRVTGPVPIKTVSRRALEALEARIVGGEWLTGVSTGIAPLDTYTLGWQRGVLSVLGARPRVGKTDTIMSSLIAAARSGRRAMLCQLDMSPDQFGARLLSHLSGVDYFKIRSGIGLSSEELDRIQTAGKEQHGWGDLLTLDFETRDIATLAAHARREARRGLDLVVVDHIGLVRGGKGEKRYLQIGDISSRMIQIARETGSAVVALGQLGRDSAGREPELEDLRESGNLEQDARCVVLIDRPVLRLGPGFCSECDGTGRKLSHECHQCGGRGRITECLTLLKVPKNEGETGARFWVHFDLARQRVSEFASEPCHYCREDR